jgi:hypothetical protein
VNVEVRRLLLLVLALAMTTRAAAEAHHSLAGMYDQSRRVMLEGVIAQFHFVNPHPFLMIDVQDASGRTQAWKAELDNRGELQDIGITPATFKPGERVTVNGSPGRDSAPLMYVWRLERAADGLLYEQIGSRPRLSPARR